MKKNFIFQFSFIIYFDTRENLFIFICYLDFIIMHFNLYSGDTGSKTCFNFKTNYKTIILLSNSGTDNRLLKF